MNIQVVYFTRSGNALRIAQKIASRLKRVPIECQDPHRYRHFCGYMKAGFYSTTNRKVKIELSHELGDFDQVILVVPLWAGKIANAGVAFLDLVPRDKIHLVVTSIGSKTIDREGFLSVSDICSRDEKEDEIIESLLSRLMVESV